VVRLDADGTLVRTAGHFAGSPIRNGRFNATIDGVTLQLAASASGNTSEAANGALCQHDAKAAAIAPRLTIAAPMINC
jgi:hypothetical protein